MRPLFITQNPNLVSTTRILQYWLNEGPKVGLRGAVVVKSQGDFLNWAAANEIASIQNSMPWFDKWRPWQAMWQARKVANWARKHQVQFIHCNEHDVYPFASLVNRFLRVPILCHVRFKLSSGFASWAFRGNACPDRLMWTSYRQREDCSSMVASVVPESQQRMLRLGLDTSHWKPSIDDAADFRQQHGIAANALTIGIASPFSPRKNVEDFIKLIQRLAPKFPNVIGLIAGGELPGHKDYAERIATQIKEANLGHQLRWLGNLEPILPFHQGSDISISTSEYESFGNSICEAMACETPVVGYDCGSVAEVIGDCGTVVSFGDLDALEEAVQELIVDSRLRKDQGTKAPACVHGV